MKKIKRLPKDFNDMHKLILSAKYRRPENLLIYYGWLNAFNSAQNGWDNEKVAQELAKYNLIVLGAGLQNPTHGDFANTTTILARIQELNPNTKIFGYVTSNQLFETFEEQADQWDDLEIDGIFLDESGYDYGKTREEFNERVNCVHHLLFAELCFVNAWNLSHILDEDDDPSYPNSTYNPNFQKSKLNMEDYCLLESFAVNTQAYTSSGGLENKEQWYNRGIQAVELREKYGVNIVGCGIINDDNTSGQSIFEFSYVSALLFALDGFGTSDNYYGASSAACNFWNRPDISNIASYWSLKPTVVMHHNNNNIYARYLDYGKFEIDFGNGKGVIIEY